MIKPEQIPAEALEAARKAFTVTDLAPAIAAALNAWEGMAHYRGGWEPVIHNNRKPHLILPLPQEARDDQ